MINETQLKTLHEEALIINTAINDMICGREYIDACRFTPAEQTTRLLCLGDCYHRADWFTWSKATALRLWERGVIATSCELEF
ncbi:hypothetical protein ACT4EA_004174 [Escherichia coli]